MLAFVLSGAGNRGPLEVGALRALIEAGHQPDMLVGTSAGAINAAYLAAWGVSLETIVYRSLPDGTEHFAFVKGDVDDGKPVLVRVQTAQPIGAMNVDLGLPSPLEAPMRNVEAEGAGVIVLIGQPGGGDSIGDTLKRRLEGGDEAVSPPRNQAEQLRDYGVGAQILGDLGDRLVGLTDNPHRPLTELRVVLPSHFCHDISS